MLCLLVMVKFAAGYFTHFCVIFISLMLSLQFGLPVPLIKTALLLSASRVLSPSEICHVLPREFQFLASRWQHSALPAVIQVWGQGVMAGEVDLKYVTSFSLCWSRWSGSQELSCLWIAMIRHYKFVGSNTSWRSSCASPTPGFWFCLVRSCSPSCNARRDTELWCKSRNAWERAACCTSCYAGIRKFCYWPIWLFLVCVYTLNGSKNITLKNRKLEREIGWPTGLRSPSRGHEKRVHVPGRAQLRHGVVALPPLELLVEEGPMRRVVVVTQGFARQSWTHRRQDLNCWTFQGLGRRAGDGGGGEQRDSGMGGMSNRSVLQVCVFTCLLSIGSLRERWEWGKGFAAPVFGVLRLLPVQSAERSTAARGRRAGWAWASQGSWELRHFTKNQEI